MALRRLNPERLFDTNARITHLNKLRDELELPKIAIPEHETDSFLKPTIGIEIEMTWIQAFRDMQERWLNSADRPRDYITNLPVYHEFAALYALNDDRLRPILERITPVIPRVGYDSYWEFSFRPVKDTVVADAELSTLYEAGILHTDTSYPTHMTIAGIPTDRDASTILCLLEQAGGTTPERLGSALTSKKGSWARKGEGGMRRRLASELEGDDQVAYEFRTLITTSPEQMSRLLTLGQDLAYTCLNHKTAWQGIQQDVEQSLKDHGLPLSVWSSPKEDPTLWEKYGEKMLKSSTIN